MQDNDLIMWLKSLPGPVSGEVLRKLRLEPDELKLIMGQLAEHWLDETDGEFSWFDELEGESVEYILYHLSHHEFEERDSGEIRFAIYFLAGVLWSQTSGSHCEFATLKKMLKSMLFRDGGR